MPYEMAIEFVGSPFDLDLVSEVLAELAAEGWRAVSLISGVNGFYVYVERGDR